MIGWYYLALPAGVLLCWLVYREWIRENKTRRLARVVASMLAVFSLLFMAFPYKKQSTSAGSNNIILLTNGYNKDSVQRFLNNHTAGSAGFADNPQDLYHSQHFTAALVADWTVFAKQHATDTIHVFGKGLNKETLQLLNPRPIVFHASNQQPTISHIYWKQHLKAGEPLIVQGHYENNTPAKIKIVLQAFGRSADSILLDAFAHRDFALHTVPVHLGRAVYALVVSAAADTLQNEPVPVEVQSVTPLQLLMLSAAPDFENTYLKNNLSQQGYQVSVNTVISTNKTNQQYVNTPTPAGGARLTQSYLNNFDVVLADEAALQKINAAELAAIQAAIRSNGMGLILKLDTVQINPAFYSRLFKVKALQQTAASFHMLRQVVTDSMGFSIKLTDPLIIEYLPGIQVLLQDAASHIYAASTLYGTGKIIASTLPNTYSIALAGDKTAYQQLWWLLLNKAAKKIHPKEIWQASPFLPVVHQPVTLQTDANTVSSSAASIADTRIYLQQDALLPFQWQGSYWPTASGWQSLPWLSATSGEWYVYRQDDWQQLRTFTSLAETRRYAAEHPVTAGPPMVASFIFTIHWPLLLLVIFLSACIFLWVEQKAG